MDNIGSEVSQKMRSAVKAKLIELGTGGSNGYIDDELPDYVMIMVANKRSKQQMKSDLNLFLGTQTDLFVTWLYEVLQKLQEVTLPVSNKRKSGDRDESSNKRDKKDKKREKKSKKSPDTQVPITSISEVITGQFIEKAKQDLLISETVKTKNEFNGSENALIADQFDIPTITEMNASISVNIPRRSRAEDLAELAAIQKKIYETKKQLKQLSSGDESEDGDFLNIKEEPEEFEDDTEKKNTAKAKSPIVFSLNENCPDATNSGTPLMDWDVEMEEIVQTPPAVSVFPLKNTADDIVEINDEQTKHVDMDVEEMKKVSIHERLGTKQFKSTDSIGSIPTHRRVEQEIYVPAFRRKAMEEQKLREERRKRNGGYSDDESSRSNSRSRINDRINRRKSSDRGNTVRNRVGSRIIVAPTKLKSKREKQEIERPVNSVIKIKPRPLLSPSKQACKNLLLRAVAEAQKSTILAKPKVSPPPSIDRTQQLYTKSFRNRVNRDSLLSRVRKDNLYIELSTSESNDICQIDNEEEEYVPEIILERDESDNNLVYVPKSIHAEINEQSENEDFEEIEDSYELNKPNQSSTQFVVTLDETAGEKFKSRLISKDAFRQGNKGKDQNMNQNRSFSNVKSRLQIKRNQFLNDRLPDLRTPSPQITQKTSLFESYRKPRDIKKIIIQNDSEDDSNIKQKNALDQNITVSHLNRSRSNSNDYRSTTPPLPPREVVINKRRRSPIKFDLNDQKSEIKQRSKTGELDESVKCLNISSGSPTDGETVNLSENEGLKISTKKIEVNKYDNVPEFLSSVAIDSPGIKNKSKEKCKYFPSCTKGDLCEFYHPTSPCKAFPNCKFSDKCLYIHPKCKFDLTCTKSGCNFSHSVPLSSQSTAPPLSSHIVPSQNFKLLMSSTATTSPPMCKYYPNCNNIHCTFFHPKLCRFGKNCINKLECNFYHQETPSKDKFKWVASVV